MPCEPTDAFSVNFPSGSSPSQSPTSLDPTPGVGGAPSATDYDGDGIPNDVDTVINGQVKGDGDSVATPSSPNADPCQPSTLDVPDSVSLPFGLELRTWSPPELTAEAFEPFKVELAAKTTAFIDRAQDRWPFAIAKMIPTSSVGARSLSAQGGVGGGGCVDFESTLGPIDFCGGAFDEAMTNTGRPILRIMIYFAALLWCLRLFGAA